MPPCIWSRRCGASPSRRWRLRTRSDGCRRCGAVQPRSFSHGCSATTRSKATCLWLRGLPTLVPRFTAPPVDLKTSVRSEFAGIERKKNRSRTFPGLAEAMAAQWGGDAGGDKRLNRGKPIMETTHVTLDRAEAARLYRKYKTAYSQPIDLEAQRAYQLLAKGKLIIEALKSVVKAGVTEAGLPKLALAGATAKACYLGRRASGACMMASSENWRTKRRALHRQAGAYSTSRPRASIGIGTVSALQRGKTTRRCCR